MISFFAPAALLALTASISSVWAETKFVQPPAAGPFGNYRDNPQYELGDRVDVQWESDLDFMDVFLWQDYPAAGGGLSYFVKLSNNTRSTSMIWSVNIDAFPQDGRAEGEDTVMYFAIYQNGVNEIVSTSHYFNVTVPEDVTTTTASTTVSAAEPTTTTASATTTTSDPTGTADPGSNDDEGGDSGLSTGAVAGIAVGATIGGILVLAAIGFFAWRHFRANKAVPPTPAVTESTAYGSTPYGSPAPAQEYYKPPEGAYTSPSFQQSHMSQGPSELGDNAFNAPPPGQRGVQNVHGLHEAP